MTIERHNCQVTDANFDITSNILIIAIYDLSGWKPLLIMQSPPTRTNNSVRVGGLCSISRDFSRRQEVGTNVG
jgi:hypothetical protein